MPTGRKIGSRGASDRIDAIDAERPCGLRAACRVLPPALLHRLIVLAGARTRIARLGVPIALKKEAEAVVAPVVAARNGDIDARPARQGVGCSAPRRTRCDSWSRGLTA